MRLYPLVFSATWSLCASEGVTHTHSQPCAPSSLRGWGEGRTMMRGLRPSPRLTRWARLDSPGFLLMPSFFLEPSVLPFPTQPNSSSSPGLSVSTVFSTKSYLLFQSTSSFLSVCPWKTVGAPHPTPLPRVPSPVVTN